MLFFKLKLNVNFIGRVPRYTVLIDENDYSMNVLQGVTHALSYEHQIVSRVTAYPSPIYIAEGNILFQKLKYEVLHTFATFIKFETNSFCKQL